MPTSVRSTSPSNQNFITQTEIPHHPQYGAVSGDTSNRRFVRAALRYVVKAGSSDEKFLCRVPPHDIEYAKKHLGPANNHDRFLSAIYWGERHGVEISAPLLAHIAIDTLRAGHAHDHSLRRDYQQACRDARRVRSMDEYNVRKKIHADSDWQAVAWRYGIKHPMEQALKKKYVECNINWMREKRVSPAAAVARAPFPTRRAVREAEKLLMESANMPKIVLEAIVNEGLSREQALATYGVDDDFLRLFDSQYLPPDAYRKCIAGTPCNAIVLSDERQDVRLTLQRIAIGNYIRNLDQLPRYSDIDLVADKLGVDNPELRLHFRKALIWRAFDKVRLGASVGDVAAELDISEPTLEKHVASWRETLRKDHLSAKRWQELLSSDLFDVASAEHSFEQAFTAAAKKLLNDLCGNTDLTSLAVIADVAENVVEGSSRNVTL